MSETLTDELHVVGAAMKEPPPPQLPAVRQERKPRQARIPAEVGKHYPPRIAQSIIKITNEIGRIQKEGRNEFQKYKYTRWEDINEKLSPLLAEHGIIIVQSEISRNLLEENDKGSVLAIVYHFTVINEHGEAWPEVEWTSIARLRDQKGVTDDKAAAKCHTQAEKQFCIKQFKIRTDDYDEDDAQPTLPKKDARDVYAKLQAEIDGADSRIHLHTWGRDNAERIEVLPKDWQDILRQRYTEKLADLKNQETEVIWEDEPHDAETGEIGDKITVSTGTDATANMTIAAGTISTTASRRLRRSCRSGAATVGRGYGARGRDAWHHTADHVLQVAHAGRKKAPQCNRRRIARAGA